MPGLHCGQLFIEKTGKLETMAKSTKHLRFGERKRNTGFPSRYQFGTSGSRYQKRDCVK